MNKVIAIYKDDIGMISVASTRKAAALFLVKDNWFSAYDDVWVWSEREHYPAYRIMGKAGGKDVTERELANFLFHVMESEDYDIGFTFKEVDVWEKE